MGTWDEEVGKTVGRRVAAEATIQDAAVLLDTIAEIMAAGICPRGVWRFKTFEEADDWTLLQAASGHAPRD
ncbi:MAG: hypothetical protein HKL90_03635 [Elusimicrobia bacterium]|nr:hypothetical protein [Elusimicrobiota bacterium]